MKILLQLFCLCIPFLLNAQNQIHVGSEPTDNSAVAQFDAIVQGVLIPRLTEAEREAISSPAQGLLVYDTTNLGFWYFNGDNWGALGPRVAHLIQDGDEDTKVWTEKNPNDDVLRFDVAGNEVLIFNETLVKMDEDMDLIVGDMMTGQGQKLFYDSSQKAFRMGEVDGSQWNESQLGENSLAFGKNNIADAYLSTAWGEDNLASGWHSTAFGNNTEASGSYATSWGSGTNAEGNYSTAFGVNTMALGPFSASFGNNNSVDGSGSTSYGSSNTVTANHATSFGVLNEANGEQSTTMGLSSVANGDNATAIGDGVIAESYAETAIGTFNTSYTPSSTTSFNASDRLFVIGNGTSDSQRSDLLTIGKNGNTRVNGTMVNFPLFDDFESKISMLDQVDEGWEFWNSKSEGFQLRHVANGNHRVISWDKDGSMEIGNTTGLDFSVDGQASKPTSGGWLANSDKRLKKNIETIDKGYALAQILKMQGVHYEWNHEVEDITRPSGIQDGFIAQQLADIWHNKVSEDKRGFLMTAYGDYDPMFVESFKAQQNTLDELKNENDNLNQELIVQQQVNEQIKERLADLYEQSNQLIQKSNSKQFESKTFDRTITNETKFSND